MQYIFGIVLAVAGLAAAQTATTSVVVPPAATGSSGCGQAIDNIINNCLDSTRLIVNACATNDYDCLCQKQTDVVTCFNNCLTDSSLTQEQTLKTQYCSAAQTYGSSSSSSRNATGTSTGTSTGTAVAGATGSSGSTAAGSASSGAASATSSGAAAASSGSSTASAAASSSSAAAANFAAPAGLAAIFGLVALL
ncbi:hypothetical protein LTR97_004652 [Elasticomyces elasticus]|uniref:Extracellular membrane protein CFEM domain-containing protein n=1 Tax=Elasticomyces elasticus TaxID=574655 RepID=A0AAN8A3I9_9PEZI|nr:hypothetical protein LTR97_004652 [Elasticomyces elasticus]KAK5724538.1 hypothetical protein LTR15_004584 [Elasticomyces elasticus]